MIRIIHLGQEPKAFTLDYDKLVIGVGSYSNTFGIPGVKEFAFFLKDVQDARRIRKRVIECRIIAYGLFAIHVNNKFFI